MKKWIAILLSAAILLMAAGCEGNTEQPTETDQSHSVSDTPPLNNADDSTTPPSAEGDTPATGTGQSAKPDSGTVEDQTQKPAAEPENPPDATEQQPASQPEDSFPPATAPVSTPEAETSHILIAYFTWADNTVVEDQDAAIQGALDHYESIGDASRYEGVDATTSASVVVPGNAAKIAGWIQQEVGGDLFSIVVTEPYSSDYDECLDRAADEKADNARPALVNHVDNMEDYDIVFIGFPNWWYTLPMAVLSFVDEYDFSGKTIVPFCTHGTGGLSSTIRDLTAALPDNVTILDPIGVYRPDVDSSRPAVQEWIAGLNLNI